MERRTFVTTMMSAAMAGSAGLSAGGMQAKPAPEFYIWRQYFLKTGTQPRRLAEFMERAMIPALNRFGHKPIGAFDVLAGLATPTLLTLTPVASLESVGTLDGALARDEQFKQAAVGYMEAAATDPVYVRQETSILAAFPNVPRVEVPAAAAKKGPRIFELRTYESHSEAAHEKKVRMFAEMGEVDIFRRVGLTPVFFSRTIAGPRMPSLVYMLTYENLAARDKAWGAFRDDEGWKKLRSTPGYSDPEIVSNITTVLLRPTPYSQI